MPSTLNAKELLRQCDTAISVILIPLMRTLRASIEHRGAFVGGPQLLRVVARLVVAALLARVVDDRVRLDVAFFEFLHVGAQAGAQRRGEGGGLGGGGDGFA